MEKETLPHWLTLGLLLLALAFMFLGTLTLYITTDIPALHLLALLGGWTVVWGVTYCILQSRHPEIDPYIIPAVALLTGWGLLLQARLASASFLFKQLAWLFIGCTALTMVAVYPTMTRWLRRFRYSLLIGGLLLLGLTLVFGVNPSGFGQPLWLGAFGIYFQPSEMLKLLFVIYLAAYLCDRRDILTHRTNELPLWVIVLAPMLIMVGIALLLLGWQQDLGAALLFYLTFVAMLYLAWGKGWTVALSLLLFVPVIIIGYVASSRVALRVSIWLNPWTPEQADRAFQILQSLFALADGGILGQGLGQGFPTLIPAVHTDFVYAALVEEFGSAGGLALLALMGIIIYRGIYWAQNTASPFESLLAGGIAALLGIQTWVIVGGNIKLIPITGVTLPYLSYGGSSLLTTMLATGVLLNISASHPTTLSLDLAVSKAPPLPRTAERLGQALLVLLMSLALGTGYWSIVRNANLRDYVTNPRHILAEARIQRGRILDRNGSVLADISIDEDGYVTRTYPVPEAAPVIGFATLQYGTDGIEATCDARLRGDASRTAWDTARDDLYHRDPVGQDIWLTMDASLQRSAQALLKGQQGAAIVVNVHTGEVLVLASNPIYDPAIVETEWTALRNTGSAPLLNRATQGLAQPGTILQSVILSLAVEQNLLETPPAELDASVSLNGNTLTCLVPPASNTWSAVLANNCPAPIVSLGEALGMETLATGLTTWGLTDAPLLEIPTVAMFWDAQAAELTAESLGQGNLLITPLQMMGVVATLGNDGVRPPLHLLASQPMGCDVPSFNEEERIVSADVAEQIRELWIPYSNNIVGHFGQALAGPERIQTWFMGLDSKENPQYAVIVTLENPSQPERTIEIAMQLLVGFR